MVKNKIDIILQKVVLYYASKASLFGRNSLTFTAFFPLI